MEIVKYLLLWIIFLNFTHARIAINFIKSYIENERKPTFLIYNNLCWKEPEKIKLVKELFTSGIRISTGLENVRNLQDHLILFLVDLDCSAPLETLNVSQHLRYPFRWLAFTENKSDNEIKYIWDLPLLADSDFVLAKQRGSTITLNELHKPSVNGQTYLNPRGFYNGSLTDTRTHRELFRRRKDIMGHTLIMSNVIQDSNTTQYHLPREDRLELQFDITAKLSWIHVRMAFEILNATPQYIFSHRWGYKQNGQWSGMINDLIIGKADLGTNLYPDTERLSVVAFTDPVAKVIVRFIFRQPPLSYVSNIFTLPFSKNVWMAIIFSFIFSTMTVYLATKWESMRMKTESTQLDGSICDAMLLTMSAIGQQGCSKEPKKKSGRIMLFFIFTSLMALYAAYSANIVVLLQASSSSIKTLEQLAFSKMTLAALDVDYSYFIFKAQRDPLKVSIYNKIKPKKKKGNFYPLNEGVELLRQGLFAFHAMTESVYRRIEETFLESEKCDLMEVDFMNAVGAFVPVYKYSPYLELLRVAFKRIHESGILMANHKRYQVLKPRCTHKVSAFSSVGILNVVPVLLFMLYGILLSFLILLAEILVHRMFKLIHKSGFILAKHKRLQVPKRGCTDKMSALSSVVLRNRMPYSMNNNSGRPPELLFMLYGILLSLLIVLTEILVHRI